MATQADNDRAAFQERYYAELAAAFCRGRLALGADCLASEAIARGREAGLRMHKFKRNAELSRVRHVLGTLRGLAPVSLLDVGSGRGAFLWPLLDEFPDLTVTVLEPREDRVRDLRAVALGGVSRLDVIQGSAIDYPLEAGAFDVVTVLEVLEHLEDVEAAARKLMGAARRFLIASVPSKPDDNPEHLRVFSVAELEALFLNAGACRVTVEHVVGHRIAVARVGP